MSILFSVVIAACGDGSEPADDGLQVVVTTSILGDVVDNIVGDDATVEVLVPIGADPHDFQASSQQVASVNKADLVVANGLHLEEGLEDVLESAAADGARVLEVGELVHPIPFGGHEGESHDEHEHEGGDDPHFWLDPSRVAEATLAIGAELADIHSSIDWLERADAYVNELNDLDSSITDVLSVIPTESRKLVTSHLSMGYFAEHYEFEVIGVIIPGGSTLGDPSSQDLASLVSAIERDKVPAIFAETTEPSALADAVAGEVGREVLVVELFTGSLGEPGSGADTYVGMMRTNATLIADALG